MAKQSSGRSRSTREFTLFSFVWRFLAALILVLATYNPTKYSYYQWLSDAIAGPDSNLAAVHFFVGALLIVGWTILLVATRSSLGTVGVILGAIVMATLVWLLMDMGWLRADSVTSVTWIILICLSAILALGLSWAHVWRRLTGQIDVTDDDQ